LKLPHKTSKIIITSFGGWHMNFNKLSKNQSGIVFLIVYLFVIVLGFLIINFGKKYDLNPIITMLIADIVMTLIVFLIGSVLKNASLYDPYWSVIPPLITIAWIAMYFPTLTFSNVLLVIVIVVWAIRLTANWWKNWSGFESQDWRYDTLREKNNKLYPLTNLFGIHLIPTIVVFIQMINVYYILQSSQVNILYLIGFILSLAAPIIQYVSDKQMYDFRTDNVNKEKTINLGLWRFSRHPNYFGEILFWVGIFVMYFAQSMTININILYPILMTLLFLFISIPMMEKKLEKRPGYIEYKKEVSMLIPFPKKPRN
jgi:steroid 5-alpha reductase family enzyme